jgi:hypothetical protein
MAKAALDKKAAGDGEAAAMEAKLLTGRFYMERLMPETATRLACITTGADVTMAMPMEAF